MIGRGIIILALAVALLGPAPAVLGQTAPMDRDNGPRDVPFAFGDRDRALMRARVLDRNGEKHEALALYESLLADSPGDVQILEPYTDLLVRLERYEEARANVREWLEQAPDSPAALIRLGSIEAATGDPDLAASAYGQALRLSSQQPESFIYAQALEGLAYALMESGRDGAALRRFTELAELQPNNQEAAIAVRQLGRERSSRYMVAYDHQVESNGGHLGRTEQSFRHWFTDDTRTELSYAIVTVNRESTSEVRALKHTLHDGRVSIHHRFTPRLEVMAGIGGHSGMADGLSQALGVRWAFLPNALVSLDLERRAPWYETLEASSFQGERDAAAFLVRWPFLDIFAVEGELVGERYYLESDPYAARLRGRLSGYVRLFEVPYVTLGYSYMRAHVEYDNNGLDEDGEYLFRPVDLIEDEDGHTLEFFLDHRFSQRFRTSLFVGWTIDTARAENPLSIAPTVEIWLTEWAILHGRLSYSTDNVDTGGGESLSAGATLELLF